MTTRKSDRLRATSAARSHQLEAIGWKPSARSHQLEAIG
jgi:hypothetical protein